ncbi:MAG: class I tRNA ligase family protein, partial [Candidatus Pacebacteria bacterium]|nr:class I tRNA ligase family protein [Candidatus Paceibacterota bacterium]
FLEKIWRGAERVTNEKTKTINLEKVLHKTIKKVEEDIEGFKFNTAIAQMMIMANELENTKKVPKDVFKDFLKVLAPFAPHIAEELWSKMGEKESIFKAAWPKWNKDKIIDEVVIIAVQVNGKVRDTLSLPADVTEDEVKKAALESEKIIRWLDGSDPQKIIYVKDKLLSIVV